MAQQLIVASGNSGKLREIAAILGAKAWEIIPQQELNIPEVSETGSTFIENAILKARNASQYGNAPALADDTGLVIDALKGAPGIYSARYAGAGATSADNLLKVLQQLEGVPAAERSARFYTVMVLLRYANDPAPLIAQGVWEGSILTAPQGHNGFGYDPIFWVADYNCSAAELAPELKNRLSHRGQALRALVALM